MADRPNIHLNINGGVGEEFNAELKIEGDRRAAVNMLAAVFKHDPELKDIFQESIHLSGKLKDLPSPKQNRKITILAEPCLAEVG